MVKSKVEPDEAYRRMIARFLTTGRLIDADYFRSVGRNPTNTYNILKQEGLIDEAVSIDANGSPGSQRITDGEGTELARDLRP
jgi:hypothetical protein